MQRILSLSALGLLLFVGSSPAQQPATSGPASTTPVVQSSTTSTAAPSNRRFGRVRGAFSNENRSGIFGRRSNRNSGNVVSAETTTQPAAEVIPVMPKTTGKETKTGTTGTKTATVTPEPTSTVVESSPAPTRRFGFREGGLLSRLGSRFGR
jgi:hypothetical protein